MTSLEDVLPPPEDWQRDHKSIDDPLAEKEHTLGFQEPLEKAKSGAHTLLIKNAGIVAIALIYLAFLMVIIYIWHLIGVDYLKWLSESNLSKIETIIGSGLTGAVLGGFAQQKLKLIFD